MRTLRFGHRMSLGLAAVWAIGLVHGEAGAQRGERELLLSNVRIFDVRSGTFSVPQNVLVRGGRIVQLGAARTADSAAVKIDAAGAYALPGLWDSHVHLSPLTLRGGDTLAATLKNMASHGILYVRDVGGPLDVMARLRQRIENGELRGPTIFFGGPLAERPPLYWAGLNTTLPGFTVPIESERDVDALITRIVDAGGTFVKVFGKWDRDLFRSLRNRATARSLGVVADPGAPFFQDLPVDTLLAVSVMSIEHAHAPWQSILRPDLRARHDSVATAAGDSARRREFVFQVVRLGPESFQPALLRALGERWKQTGAFFCPTLRVTENWRRSPPPLSTARSDEDRSRFWNGWADASVAITKALASQGIPLLVGQDDLESMATFEEMEVLARIGIPPADVLRAATLNPARALNRETELGAIAAGKVADLVLLREDPLEAIERVRAPWLVVQRGEVIYRRD